MPLNDPSTDQTAWRRPVARLLVNGTPMGGLIEFHVTSSGNYQADRWNVRLALNYPNASTGWWDADEPLVIAIDAAFIAPAADPSAPPKWTRLISGEADEIEPVLGEGVIELAGRDLSARLIEYKLAQPFLNQTAGQIAATLADAVGLKSSITPTTTPVNRYYEDDHDMVALAQFHRTGTAWDTLTFLAQREGFAIYVEDDVLHFEPAPDPSTADPFVLQWRPASNGVPARGNFEGLKLRRSMTVARDVEVDVLTYHSGKGQATPVKVRSSRGGWRGDGPPAKYVFVKPNLSRDAAAKFAQAMAEQITKHERVIEADLPGDLTLTPRNVVRLQGTGTSFDQTYFIDEITRTMSFEDGMQVHLRCKNTSPIDATTIT